VGESNDAATATERAFATAFSGAEDSRALSRQTRRDSVKPSGAEVIVATLP
jgi:hypothetical protein